MVREVVDSYKELFDEKIENSTVVVLAISWLIVLVGFFLPDTYGYSWAHKEYHSRSSQILHIDGEQYRVSFTKK